MFKNKNLALLNYCSKHNFSTQLLYVPKHDPVSEPDIFSLKNFIKNYNRILIVTGAGISTESGIPDYRSEGVGLYARTNRKPILYQTYLNSPFARQRYWARNFVGWPKFSNCTPNEIHHALQKLESNNKLTTIVTQNVDNLHNKAGSKNVIELHGSAFRIMCLGCDATMSRFDFQNILTKLNPYMTDTTTMIRPDGDVEIPDDQIDSFRVPLCSKCGGIFKPDVVFFGDNVPSQRVNLVKENVANSDAVLVLGSSLTVFSSYRIILQADSLNLPIAIVNIGQTRADHLASMKIAVKCGDILPKICNEMFT